MTDYIYVRVSTDHQQFSSQAVSVEQMFPDAIQISETASGAKSRPNLEKLTSELKKGDRLIVAALDRLGRRTSDVLTLIESLTSRGVALISIREGVDYSTPAGRLVTQILVSVAEMERNMISERTKLGLKAAKAKGKKLGAPLGHARSKGWRKTHPKALIDEIKRLTGKGRSCREIADILHSKYTPKKISYGTVFQLQRRYCPRKSNSK